MQYVFGRRLRPPIPATPPAATPLAPTQRAIVLLAVAWLANAPHATARKRGSGSIRSDASDDFTVTTFAQTAIAIATVAGLSLVLLAISLAFGSLLLLLVALGFASLGAVFVHRLLRL